MKIAFLGNFSVPYSTESHHKLTWERMGHEVVALQEGRAATDQFLAAAEGAQLVQITHTHGWPFSGSMTPDEMMLRLRDKKIPTMSYHLDYYWGLNQWDRREERIGRTWDWRVDYFFSTDGSHDEEFKERGVNHVYLPPAVVETGCYEGVPQAQYSSPVGFTGSVIYHPEYPFRQALVEGLTVAYKNRFKTFHGVREGALNDLYASVKVVAGDHVFAGRPRYWSDRVPEVCGRGGFLVHPRTEGLDIPVATYEPQSVDSLVGRIDYYLSHDAERESLRKECHEYVKNNHTYRHRLDKILQVMGLA